MTSNLKPEFRKKMIMSAALVLAEKRGYKNITRAQIGKQANVSPALVSRYFGTMDRLQVDIMQAAVRKEIIPILAQGMVDKNRIARRAPQHLKDRVKEFIGDL